MSAGGKPRRFEFTPHQDDVVVRPFERADRLLSYWVTATSSAKFRADAGGDDQRREGEQA